MHYALCSASHCVGKVKLKTRRKEKEKAERKEERNK
jgi:hypothetical protein